MKKLFLMAMTLILSVSVMAQQKIQLRSVNKVECVKSDMTSLKARFSFSSLDASKVETTRGEFSEIHIDGTFPNGKVGEPQLPMFTRLIAIPTGATPVVTVATHSETQYTLSDYGIGTVAAMQAPVRKNVDPSTVEYAFSEAAYSRNSYNNDPIAMVEVLGTMRGITLGRIIVRPVCYNPVAGTVKVINDIEVDIDFQNGDAASTAQIFKKTFSPAFNSVYDQIFNVDMLTGGTRDAYTDHPDFYNTPVKMLVICYSGFKNNSALNSWLQWKLQKGYYVDIFYTDQTGTTSSAIASFIKTKYNASVSAGNAYTYLITIGDTEQVPYYVAEYEDNDVTYVGSDLGYASVDYPTNSNDVFPDMYYSRMSVENTTQLTNYINKVLTYEKYEFTDGGNYLNNVILVGGWDSDWTSVVARPTINYATTYYFNSSNTTYGGFGSGTIKATIATGSGDNCSTPGYSGTNNGCYQGINNGACFVNYTAHGNKQEWFAPKMTAKQVETLTNTGKYFFGVGNCCLTGNFNLSDASYSPTYAPSSSIGTTACFAETMIRVPNAGAIAYIGCSDYTIWMEDYYWAVGSGIHFTSNYDLNGTATTSNTTMGVYDAMFTDGYWNSASSLLFVGNIAVTAAENNSTGYDIGEGYKYYFKYYHTFGDGSVMPYITKPEANTVTIPSTITAGTNTITVNAVAGSYVAVTDNSSVIYGVAEANTSGVATVNFTEAIPDNGTLHVVVTRQQYQPYFGTISVISSGTQYTITTNASPTAGGTVTGGGTYYENTQRTLTATANHGYAFQRWNDNNTDNPRTITVTGNASYTAYFRQLEEHHITYNAQQSHGTISVSPTNAYAGDIVTLTATPDAGYVLDHWTVTTVSKETIPVENNQFVMPDSEVTVSATFKIGEPLTVANGTGTNTEIPFYGLYADDNYQHTQTIYPASMLTDMQGCEITKLTYYLNSSITQSFGSTFQIRLGTTTSTEFSTGTVNYISMTGNPVYSGTLTVSGATVEFDFEGNPYLYSGGNLVVDVRTTALATGYKSMSFYGESGSTYYSVKNRSTSSLPTASGTSVSFMPKTTFAYQAPSTCFKPQNLQATLTPGNGTIAALTWERNASGTENAWVLEYSTNDNFNGATSVNVTSGTPSANLTGLTPETTYYARVKPECDTDGSKWSATCIFTPSEKYEITVNDGTTTGNTVPVYGYWADNKQRSEFIIPASKLSSLGGATLISMKFYANYNFTSNGSFTVYLKEVSETTFNGTTFYTDEGATTVYTGTVTISSTDGMTITFQGDGYEYNGGNLLIGFNKTTTNNNYSDNSSDAFYGVTASGASISYYSSNSATQKNFLPKVTFNYALSASCKVPTNLTPGTPGANNVQLSWTAKGTETQWQICLNGDESNLTLVSTNPYTLTGLTPATEYTVKVRAYCDASDQSEWSNEITFETESSCPVPTNVITNNLTHNSADISWNSEMGDYIVQYRTATVSGTTLDPVFEDGFENGLGSWTTYAKGFSNENTNWQTFDASQFTSGSNHGGNYSAMSRSWTKSTGDVSVDNWLVSPRITLGNTLKFWVATNGDFPDSYAVYVSTGSGVVPSSGTGDFAVLANLTPATGTWTEQTYDLSAYAGQQGYIAIRHKDNAKDHLIVDDFGVYNTINTYSYGTAYTVNTTSNSCKLTGLSAETLYEVKVKANCGDTDGISNWSAPIYFTTPDACTAPTDLVSSNITHNSATLDWADNQDSYNVRYRKVYFYEGFEGETLPTGWTTIDANNDGNCWLIGSAKSHTGANGAYNISYIYQNTDISPDDYLVSPLLDLQGTLRVWLTGNETTSYAEHFAIYLSTTGNTASDFTTTLVAESTTTNSYVEYTADLSSYEGQRGYIAIRHFNCTDQREIYVDDFGLYGNEGTNGWMTANPNDATVNLTGLSMNTNYEWQVQGINCDGNGGNTEWSTAATFTTLEAYTKHIDPYTTDGGYYLIASPIGQVSPTNVTNMLNNTYDLYFFEENPDIDPETNIGPEWINYKDDYDGGYNLQPGMGYLYANSGNNGEGIDLVFTGAANTDVNQVYLSLTTGAEFEGMNLVGNPFGVEAYIDRPFYRMADGGAAISSTTSSGAIGVMEGVFVEAASDGESLTFTTTNPNAKIANLTLNLTKGNSFVDRAIVCFSETRQLSKFQFRKGSTKVYIPMEGKDYAVVRSEAMGTMPVNFKAENNGSYTLSFTTEEVSFAYLHLIDNMTGIETDLLANPSYTFEARTTDYESRFKLVFATGNNANDDNFAFFTNGSFVINNEGEATLQVIDINGRILKSVSINGCTNVNVNAAAGVYMLRLVNGNDVKVQKVVVR